MLALLWSLALRLTAIITKILNRTVNGLAKLLTMMVPIKEGWDEMFLELLSIVAKGLLVILVKPKLAMRTSD